MRAFPLPVALQQALSSSLRAGSIAVEIRCAAVDAHHGWAQPSAHVCQHLGIVVVSHSLQCTPTITSASAPPSYSYVLQTCPQIISEKPSTASNALPSSQTEMRLHNKASGLCPQTMRRHEAARRKFLVLFNAL